MSAGIIKLWEMAQTSFVEKQAMISLQGMAEL